MFKNLIFVLILSLLVFFVRNSTSTSKNRTKRHLIYPVGGGTFKLIVGLGIPTKLGIRQSMALGMNFQFQYALPADIAQLEKPFPPIIAKSRERRHEDSAKVSDRSLFYMGLAAAMSSNGTDGTSCVLRSICDNAMHSLKHSSNGLFGELMHIALTPSIDTNGNEDNDVYVDAQRAGEFGVDCVSVYPGCPAGANLLDTLSVLDN
ncbi:uncharacterized protein [Atheta coriaria]|uniref:uncharacterized protein n=1 Tax=Dalotia coriaria TaxID=877792 RepID=UPI0031F428D6